MCCCSHSDLIVLKRLLLGDRVESLYAMLDDSYSRYVAFCTAFEESGKQLQMVVQDACQVSAAVCNTFRTAGAEQGQRQQTALDGIVQQCLFVNTDTALRDSARMLHSAP